MTLAFQPAVPTDAPECVRLRGLTRENAVPEERLRSLGITAASWAEDIGSGLLPGFVCRAGEHIAGYCFGNSRSGEIVVLALLPAFEGQGIGKRLLGLMVDHLRGLGHTRLFLGCSSDPAVRSYGFYRHLGWRTTGSVDRLGDELLELALTSAPTLHFMCGKAGAGKSTLAQKLAAAERALLISEDIWLSRLFGDRMHTFDDYLAFAPRLRAVIGPLAVDTLRSGRSVVLDFPANTRLGRAWFRSLFEQAGCAHVLHFVDTPNEVCLQQIAKRNVERPEGSHHVSEEVFLHVTSFFEAPAAEEGFDIRVYGPGAAA